MVYIPIGSVKAPDFGIDVKIGRHILMHVLLEIKIKGFAVCPDNHVYADASIPRYVTAGVR